MGHYPWWGEGHLSWGFHLTKKSINVLPSGNTALFLLRASTLFVECVSFNFCLINPCPVFYCGVLKILFPQGRPLTCAPSLWVDGLGSFSQPEEHPRTLASDSSVHQNSKKFWTFTATENSWLPQARRKITSFQSSESLYFSLQQNLCPKLSTTQGQKRHC